MLARARERAAEQGLRNLRFLEADAQQAELGRNAFDLVFSRFGVMFFADPKAAFANLRSSLGPGGRLCFVCWQALAQNPWMSVPLRAVAQVIPLPPPPAPDAPGPLAFADPDRVRGILTGAGFREVAIEPLQGEMAIGGSSGGLDQAVEFALQMGPLARVLRDAVDPPVERLAAAVREALAPHATPNGVVLGCSAWVVSARSATA
jgi:SAM-dependent methyltransferase